jgi:hypothetical protein
MLSHHNSTASFVRERGCGFLVEAHRALGVAFGRIEANSGSDCAAVGPSEQDARLQLTAFLNNTCRGSLFYTARAAKVERGVFRMNAMRAFVAFAPGARASITVWASSFDTLSAQLVAQRPDSRLILDTERSAVPHPIPRADDPTKAPTTESQRPAASRGLSSGEVAIIVVGVIAFSAIIVALIVAVYIKRRRLATPDAQTKGGELRWGTYQGDSSDGLP